MQVYIWHWNSTQAHTPTGKLLRHLDRARHSSGSKISPSCGPVAPSCPTYRTPEITLLTVDLLSHRAFSTVIPDCSHSCEAKIDLHPCASGSAKQILDCDSALLNCHGRDHAVKTCSKMPLLGRTNFTKGRLGYFFPLTVRCNIHTVRLPRNCTPWRQSRSLQGLRSPDENFTLGITHASSETMIANNSMDNPSLNKQDAWVDQRF